MKNKTTKRAPVAQHAGAPWTPNFDGTITGQPHKWPPRDPGRVDATIVACVIDGECGQYRHYPRTVATANQRLIAAAPELLRACKSLVEELRLARGMGENIPDTLGNVENGAIAAIAKAEGRK